jgi:hypothetical protein
VRPAAPVAVAEEVGAVAEEAAEVGVQAVEEVEAER